ncbi:hypothetical protein WA026_008633 [Henosepilachna vigintioctopunctata]|uniref:Uncharacterized protein n=1 Tax=Henosepilachna vigintioctopunctata TaxID=420089 RepID=A0AAW1UBT9_9CUCU
MSSVLGIAKFVSTLCAQDSTLQMRRHYLRYFMNKRCSFSYPKVHLRVCNFVVPRRTFLEGGLSWKPGERKFKKIDGIPDDFNLIYRSSTYLLFKWGYFLACVITASVFGTILYTFEYEKSEMTLGKNDDVVVNNEAVCYITALLAFFIAVQTCITRMPVRIYNSPLQKKYIFTFNGTIPLTTKIIKCYEGEVVKYKPLDLISNVLPWNKCGYLLPKSTKIYLFEELFRNPSDLQIMLGHQDNTDSN